MRKSLIAFSCPHDTVFDVEKQAFASKSQKSFLGMPLQIGGYRFGHRIRIAAAVAGLGKNAAAEPQIAAKVKQKPGEPRR